MTAGPSSKASSHRRPDLTLARPSARWLVNCTLLPHAVTDHSAYLFLRCHTSRYRLFQGDARLMTPSWTSFRSALPATKPRLTLAGLLPFWPATACLSYPSRLPLLSRVSRRTISLSCDVWLGVASTRPRRNHRCDTHIIQHPSPMSTQYTQNLNVIHMIDAASALLVDSCSDSFGGKISAVGGLTRPAPSFNLAKNGRSRASVGQFAGGIHEESRSLTTRH